MLKFSGYSYLIRGQHSEVGGFYGEAATITSNEVYDYYAMEARRDRQSIWGTRVTASPNTKLSLRVEMTLEQACPPEYWRAQCAFKDSMIH